MKMWWVCITTTAYYLFVNIRYIETDFLFLLSLCTFRPFLPAIALHRPFSPGTFFVSFSLFL